MIGSSDCAQLSARSSCQWSVFFGALLYLLIWYVTCLESVMTKLTISHLRGGVVCLCFHLHISLARFLFVSPGVVWSWTWGRKKDDISHRHWEVFVFSSAGENTISEPLFCPRLPQWSFYLSLTQNTNDSYHFTSNNMLKDRKKILPLVYPSQHFVAVGAPLGFRFLFFLFLKCAVKEELCCVLVKIWFLTVDMRSRAVSVIYIRIVSTRVCLLSPAEVCRERELGERRSEQAVPPCEDTLPAIRPSWLEPQWLDGPQGGGVRVLLQWVTLSLQLIPWYQSLHWPSLVTLRVSIYLFIHLVF